MLLSHDALLIVIVALVCDAVIGDPDFLWRRFPHPVTLIGRVIGFFDVRLNRDNALPGLRKLAGAATVALLVATAGIIGFSVETALRQTGGGIMASVLLNAIVASVLIAQRSLAEHVIRVKAAFTATGLQGARREVAMIVGRDPEQLDEAGVSRAAIESCAENFSDGVVAPVFWLALLGLPGLLVYKTINTADSMIGHRSARHQDFGWAAARLDDLVNLIPARMSGMLIALVAPFAGGSIIAALKTMLADAGKHRSPNAGWPEAAMAGALGIALAGPRVYASGAVDDPWLNPAGRAATPDDIGRAVRVMIAACVAEATIYAALIFVL